MKIEKVKTEDNNVLICIEDDLTINNIEEIKFNIKSLINDNNINLIDLKLKNIEKIDFTFIQMLYSILITVKKINKKIIIKNLPEIVEEEIKISGFYDKLNDIFEGNKNG